MGILYSWSTFKGNISLSEFLTPRLKWNLIFSAGVKLQILTCKQLFWPISQNLLMERKLSCDICALDV